MITQTIVKSHSCKQASQTNTYKPQNKLQPSPKTSCYVPLVFEQKEVSLNFTIVYLDNGRKQEASKLKYFYPLFSHGTTAD